MVANCSIICHCETYQKRIHEWNDTRVAPISYVYILWGGHNKSLAQPGMKQAIATKLRIYSTYSPRSSIHFLACCSNFCKPLKKIQKIVRLRGSNDFRLGREMANFQLFFQSNEQVVVRWGQIRRIGWVIKTVEAQVGQFLLGCKCMVSRGIVVQEQDPLGELPATLSLQNILQLHQQRWVILRVVSLALWKIINEEDAVLIQKKSRRELFQRVFALGIFWGGVSRYAATPVIVDLSLGHSDIMRFRPWSPIATGNHLDRVEKIPIVAQTTGTLDVFDPRSGISEPTSRRASACPNLHEWWTQPTRSREMPSCSAIDLAEIRRSSKISSWIWSIISGLITFFRSFRTRRIIGGNITTSKLGHLVFDGGIRWCMSPDMLPFSLYNEKIFSIRHMNRSLFPTTTSIPSYDIRK